MKIAIAASGLGHVYRGMEGWSEDLAKALSRKRVDVTLFRGAGPRTAAYDRVLSTPKRNSVIAKIIAKMTAKVAWRIGLGSPHGVESFLFGLRLLWHVRKGYDLVHIKQGSLALLMQRAKKLGLVTPPVVLSNGQIANQDFLSLFDYVQHLTICRENPCCDENTLGELPQNRFIIPNFVDTELFSPQDQITCRAKLGLPQNAIIVLTVGAIKKYHKRMDYFIEESSIVAKNTENIPLHFTIAGAQDPETNDIVGLGRKRLGDKLTVLLDVPRNRMPEVYGAADVFVLCSLSEAFGTVFIEAMSCQIPVVAHTHRSFDWIVQDGGILTDMRKRGSLARVLEDYIRSKSLRSRKAAFGRQKVLSQFSEEVVVTQVMQMYRTIISNRR